jgi:hypothetical protein
MPDEFCNGTNWEQSSGPYCNRYFEAADLWPNGPGSEIDGGAKDSLALASTTQAELHPVLAIGDKAYRPKNQTGIVVKYESASKVLVNVAACFIARQYVSNITAYTTGSGSAWNASIDAGTPVYLDDSGPLSSGCTLSLAQTNESGSQNPIAGWVTYCQDDYLDSDFGGLHATAGLPYTAAAATDEEVLMCVELTPYSAW